MSLKKILAIVVIVLGVVNMGLGITFISIGADKQSYLQRRWTENRSRSSCSDEQIAAGRGCRHLGGSPGGR